MMLKTKFEAVVVLDVTILKSVVEGTSKVVNPVTIPFEVPEAMLKAVVKEATVFCEFTNPGPLYMVIRP